MQAPWDNPAQEFRPQMQVFMPNLEMMKIHESGGVSHVFQAVNTPRLKSLSYRCPPRYLDYQTSSFMPADAMLTLVEKGASTIRNLMLEPLNLRPEDTLTCLRLTREVSYLILNCTPYFISNAEDDILGDDSFDLNLLRIHDNSSPPDKSQDIILPKLEFLEVNDIRKFTDENILCLLTNRIDAARRGDVSPLRRLKLQISRHRQRDIEKEAVELAKSAGFELKLELNYPPDAPLYNGRLSPSFAFPVVNPLEEAWPPYTLDFIHG
jgi:hypothetical protein